MAIALPVTIAGTQATVDCAAVASGAPAEVTFAYGAGATDAGLRACSELFAAAGGNLGRLRTQSWVVVGPVSLADGIAAGDVCQVHYAIPDLFLDSVTTGVTPNAPSAYITVADLEPYLGGALDPARAQRAIDAASEHVDFLCGQSFTLDVPASIEMATTQVAVRYYRDPEAPFGVLQSAAEASSFTKTAIPDLDVMLLGLRISWGPAWSPTAYTPRAIPT